MREIKFEIKEIFIKRKGSDEKISICNLIDEPNIVGVLLVGSERESNAKIALVSEPPAADEPDLLWEYEDYKHGIIVYEEMAAQGLL